MKFGVTVVPRVADWKLFVDLEAMGYDCAWAADSQMLYSDAYAVLALAAANTSRIRLGTGVSVAGVRLAPVTAHSIATINKLAPGRVFLGIGTGHTAMRVMGKDPMKAAAFREYLRVLRALLHGEEVDYALDAENHDIRFLTGASLTSPIRCRSTSPPTARWRSRRPAPTATAVCARTTRPGPGCRRAWRRCVRAPPPSAVPCRAISIPRRSAMPACCSRARP